jgi:hypothetical protein
MMILTRQKGRWWVTVDGVTIPTNFQAVAEVYEALRGQNPEKLIILGGVAA